MVSDALMYVYFAVEQMHQYSGYSEIEPTPLANDVAAVDVLKQVVNAQFPRYNQVCQNLLTVTVTFDFCLTSHCLAVTRR